MQFSFDTESVPKSERSFDVLPAGWYDAQITESSVEQTKSGTGQYIKIRIDILTEPHRGRVVFARLNVRNDNPVAERIGQQQMRDICEAVGITRLTDTSQLHNKPLQVKLKVRVDSTGTYDPSNELAGARAIGAGASAPISASRGFPAAPPRTLPPQAPAPAPSAAPQAPFAPPPQAPAAPGGTPPWAVRA